MSKHRLELLAEELGLSIGQLETKVGASRSRFTKAIERNSKITYDIVALIRDVYPTINEQWLLTGTGEMFIKPTPAKPSDNKQSTVKESDTPYKKPQSLYNITAELWDLLTSPKSSTQDILEADEVLRKLIERAKKEK